MNRPMTNLPYPNQWPARVYSSFHYQVPPARGDGKVLPPQVEGEAE